MTAVFISCNFRFEYMVWTNFHEFSYNYKRIH